MGIITNHRDTNPRFSFEAEQTGKSGPVVIPVLDFFSRFFYAQRQPTFVLRFLMGYPLEMRFLS